MKVILDEKYQKIQEEIFNNHKVSGFDFGTKATNELLEEVSKMIAEALQMLEKENK
jgi:cell fate (sporulation/competence/biofilm development) regulator YlbF (YheA/YmcA/DUF963 family)